MTTIEFLRQFRIGGYAIFDFTVAFLGVYLLSPLLSKLFLRLRISIPKRNRLFLTLPISILFHLIFQNITPMTRDVIDIHGHYPIKIVMIVLIILGMRGIRITKKNKDKLT